MNKKEFEKIEAKNPNSRIWSREFSYQKARDRLARVLKNDIKILEIPARINYLVEKIFSVKRIDKRWALLWEKISKEDYDFVLWLSTKNLKKFHSKIKNRVLKYWHYLRERYDGDELPEVYSKYVGKFNSWNQMLRFISQTRNDIHSETFQSVGFGIDQEMSKSLTDKMKSIYPNRDEMVATNEAERKTKEEDAEQTPVKEEQVKETPVEEKEEINETILSEADDYFWEEYEKALNFYNARREGDDQKDYDMERARENDESSAIGNALTAVCNKYWLTIAREIKNRHWDLAHSWWFESDDVIGRRNKESRPRIPVKKDPQE